MARHALLLGVPDYDDEKLRIPAASNDVRDLASALKLAGYADADVRSISSGLTTSRLRKAIADFLEMAGAGDDLVIYFSGHGVVFEGRRLLVPVDFEPQRPHSVVEMLSDFDIYVIARESTASSVTVFLDACRDGIRLTLSPVSVAKALSPPSASGLGVGPTIAIVHSCEQDASSYFDSGVDGRSHFLSALCSVLASNDEPPHLSGILSRIGDLLRFRGLGQTPVIGEQSTGRSGPPASVLIKENFAERLAQRIRDSAWCVELRAAPLFSRLSASPGLVRQSELIVLRCEDTMPGPASTRRWRADNPLGRILQRMALLLPEQSSPCNVTVPEAALLLVAPFVYESVLALAESMLSEGGDPYSDETYSAARSPAYIGLAWSASFVGDHRWKRRRELVKQRDQESARDIAAWQLVRFLHGSGELWQIIKGGSARRVWLGDNLERMFELGPFGETLTDPKVGVVLAGDRLVRLARAVFCSVTDVEASYREDASTPPRRFHGGEGPEQWEVDERKIAHLLSLAGRLALDARRLSESPAEHIGIDSDVNAKSIVDSLQLAEWHRAGEQALSLSLDCFHQALDYSLGLEVAALDEHLRWLKTSFPGEAWVMSLPSHANHSSLKPVVRHGRKAYERPHVQLQLDPERIRELLMGPKLYGDPVYALREAYQNALDACRYRRARDRYLVLKKPSEVSEYVPTITIRTGEDDQGRPFVECEDNGIGMERRHLEGLFASAGRRFADSHEFHLEKAAWDEAGVPFWSNSRFGIGVLAYFMLADEVVVWTRRMSNVFRGAKEHCLVARILSGTELFRMGAASDECPAGGTRVRLYLDGRPKHQVGPELLQTTLKWLAIAEVELRLFDGRHSFRDFKAGVLAPQAFHGRGDVAGGRILLQFTIGPPDALGQFRLFGAFVNSALEMRSLSGQLLRQSRSSGGAAWSRLWGPPGQRIIPLADGIMLEDDRHSHLGGFAVVANLKGDLAPALSVDRNKLLDWSAGREWAVRTLRNRLFGDALSASGMTLEMLGALSLQFPFEAVEFNRTLISHGSHLLPFSSMISTPVDVSAVGVSQSDNLLSWMLETKEVPIEAVGGGGTILRSRLAQLCKGGLILDGWVGALATFDLGSGKNEPPADLRMAFAALPPWGDPLLRPDAARLVPSAAAWKVPVRDLLELSHCLSAFDCDFSSLNTKSADSPPSDRAARLLARDLDLSPPFLRNIPLSQMAAAAARWGLSLGEVAAIAEPYVETGVSLPKLAPTTASLRPDGRLVSLLSRRFDSRGPYLESVPILRCVRAAAAWSLSVGEVMAIAGPLGPASGQQPAVPDYTPDPRLADLLTDDAEQSGSATAITPPAIVRAAERLGVTLREVIALARPLADLGISLPTLDPAALDIVPEDRAWRLASNTLSVLGSSYGDHLPVSQVVAAAADWELSIGEVLELGQSLAFLGMTLPTIPAKALSYRPSARIAELLSNASEDYPIPFFQAIEPVQLLRLTASWRMSLGEVSLLVTPLAELGVKVPTIPPEAAGFRPDDRLAMLLSKSLNGSAPYIEELTIGQVVMAAQTWRISLAEVLKIAHPLQLLGVDLPALDPATASIRPQRVLSVLMPVDPEDDDDDNLFGQPDVRVVGQSLPLWVALNMDRFSMPIQELKDDLLVLAACGVDTSDALQFIDFASKQQELGSLRL